MNSRRTEKFWRKIRWLMIKRKVIILVLNCQWNKVMSLYAKRAIVRCNINIPFCFYLFMLHNFSISVFRNRNPSCLALKDCVRWKFNDSTIILEIYSYVPLYRTVNKNEMRRKRLQQIRIRFVSIDALNYYLKSWRVSSSLKSGDSYIFGSETDIFLNCDIKG